MNKINAFLKINLYKLYNKKNLKNKNGSVA